MARLEEDVLAELKALGCEYLGAGQLRELARTLRDGEAVVEALYGELLHGDARALLVLTAARVIGVQETSTLWAGEQVTLGYVYWRDVARVDVRPLTHSGPRGLTVYGVPNAGQVTVAFRPTVSEASFEAIAQSIQDHVARMKAVGWSLVESAGSVVDQIERLVALRDSGVLSDVELQRAKRKLLSE